MSEVPHQIGLGLLTGALGVFVVLLVMGRALSALRGEEEWSLLLSENRLFVIIALGFLSSMAIAGICLIAFS